MINIVCSLILLIFVIFNKKETNDDILLFKNELICRFQLGTIPIKTDDGFSFANVLKIITLCKSPKVKEYWIAIVEELQLIGLIDISIIIDAE